MKTETKKVAPKKEKVEDVPLSQEFREEIKGVKSKRKKSTATWILIILILLVFGSLVVGTYQIFFRSEKIDQIKDDSASKIENRPEIPETPVVETPQATVPENTTPTTPDPTPAPSVTEYTVQAGDTWSSVANANGMTSKELMDYNSATSEDLQIGQNIKIPKS